MGNRMAQNFQNERWAIRDRSFGFARPSRATPGYFPSGTDSWVIPVPLGPTNKGPATTMWVNQMGVPKGVPSPDMSFELLRAGVDLKGQTVMHQLAQWEPSMPAYHQTQAFKDELKKDSLLQVGLDSFKTGKTFPFYRRFSVISVEPYAPPPGRHQGRAPDPRGPGRSRTPHQPGAPGIDPKSPVRSLGPVAKDFAPRTPRTSELRLGGCSRGRYHLPRVATAERWRVVDRRPRGACG